MDKLTNTVQFLVQQIDTYRQQIDELITSHRDMRISHRQQIEFNSRRHAVTVQELELVIIELRRNQPRGVLPYRRQVRLTRRPGEPVMEEGPDWGFTPIEQGSLEEKHTENVELLPDQDAPAHPIPVDAPAPPSDDDAPVPYDEENDEEEG